MAVYFCMRLTSIIPLPNPSLFSAFLPGMTAQMDLWIQQIFMEHLLHASLFCGMGTWLMRQPAFLEGTSAGSQKT